MAIDYHGIAEVIGAIVVGIPSITAAVISLVNLRRSARRDSKIEEIHGLVNGQSQQLNALNYAAGVVAGNDQARTIPIGLP